MHDFWAWASANPFSTFVLFWVAMVMAAKVAINFLMIFQRRPATMQLTDEQFESIRGEVAKQVVTRASQDNSEPDRNRPSGRPWYERLS